METLLAIGYLDLLSSISGEYLFGGLPRLCLKGKLYPAEVSMSFIKEGVPILLTSGITSGGGPAGTERWGDSGSSHNGVSSISRGFSPNGVDSVSRGSSPHGVSF